MGEVVGFPSSEGTPVVAVANFLEMKSRWVEGYPVFEWSHTATILNKWCRLYLESLE